jgi:DNA ligase (NAD+)
MSKLNGKKVLISGVFEKYSRKELTEIIINLGGQASSSVSKNLSFILAGDKMGPSKKEKAQSLGIPLIDEETFIDQYIED